MCVCKYKQRNYSESEKNKEDELVGIYWLDLICREVDGIIMVRERERRV